MGADSTRATILIVDDESEIRTQLRWALKDEYEILEAGDGDEAMRRVAGGGVDLVLLDLRFPPETSAISGGKKILDEIRRARPELPVVIMTGDKDRQTAVEMVARGAFDLFRKPIDIAELRVILKRALRMRGLEREVRRLQCRLGSDEGLDNVVGRSPAVRELVRLVRKVADTSATVLITGESGTGKELIARALHRLSSRRDRAFAALSCATVPPSLIDDELFGHEKGAFTGAVGRRAGKFEFADGGTLFLDEVGDLPEPVQMKLLRVLQESEIQRLGGNTTIEVDVRLVSATHQDLEQRVRQGLFRQDFYYRLKVVQLVVPPLRQRGGDVRLLAEHFLGKHAGPSSPRAFSPEALAALAAHDWPGNVRQLENLVNALSVTCDGPIIEVEDLPAEVRGGEAGGSDLLGPLPAEGVELAAVERELIRRALDRTAGNRTRAAKLLGISRHVLLGKLRRHGLDG